MPTDTPKPAPYWHERHARYTPVCRQSAAQLLRRYREAGRRVVRGTTVHGQRFYSLESERCVHSRLYLARTSPVAAA